MSGLEVKERDHGFVHGHGMIECNNFMAWPDDMNNTCVRRYRFVHFPVSNQRTNREHLQHTIRRLQLRQTWKVWREKLGL
jgi:hypothetical protein